MASNSGAAVCVAISDLHAGAGVVNDFDPDVEELFRQFLATLAGRPEPVELVLNGDVLDFVQAPPIRDPELESRSTLGVPLCFTQDQSLEKLRVILDEHKVFIRALRDFLIAKPENRIVILPGNHDADFFWPLVRDAFLEAASAGDVSLRQRIRFILEAVYRPPLAPEVWIEHGQQYDPLNQFFLGDYPCWSEKDGQLPILKDQFGTERLYECIGTRLLLRFLNRLDEDYPFVDNVKPFMRFVRIFGWSFLHPGHGPVRFGAALWSALKFAQQTVQDRGVDELLSIEGPTEAWRDGLLQTLRQMPRWMDQRFADELKKRGLTVSSSWETFLKSEENLERLSEKLAEDEELAALLPEFDTDLLGVNGDDDTLALKRGFQINETTLLTDAATRIMGANPDVRWVIMGHTHEPVRDPRFPHYFNTGSWTRYYRFDSDPKATSWSLLKKESADHFPYELNWVEIDPRQGLQVSMKVFRAGK